MPVQVLHARSADRSEEGADPFAGWCRRLQASDRAALGEVFRAMYDSLFGYALRFTTDRSVAGDLLQDVFLKLWESRASLDPSRSLKALLYRMVRNLALNHHRDTATRQAKLATLDVEPAYARPGAELDTDQLQELLHTWIDELPERQREALVLSRFEGLRHDEIAAVMEVSPRTVNNHVVRALKYLRKRICTYDPSLLSD